MGNERNETISILVVNDGLVNISAPAAMELDWMAALKLSLILASSANMSAAAIGVTPETWERALEEAARAVGQEQTDL